MQYKHYEICLRWVQDMLKAKNQQINAGHSRYCHFLPPKKQQEEASSYIDFPHLALDSIRFQDTMMVWAPTISRSPKAFPGPGRTERWKGGKTLRSKLNVFGYI